MEPKNGEMCHESTCPPFGMSCDHLGDRWCLMMSLMLILASVYSVEIDWGILRKGSSNEWRTILTASEGLEELPDQLKDVMLLLPPNLCSNWSNLSFDQSHHQTLMQLQCWGESLSMLQNQLLSLTIPSSRCNNPTPLSRLQLRCFPLPLRFFQSSGAVLFNDVILFEHRILFGPITICGLKGHMTGRWGRLWPGVREWAEIDRLIYQQLSSFNIRLRFFPS